jgi:hypothetical protein
LAAELLVKILVDNELENGVPEKLKPLIIKMIALRLVTETGMSQGLRQQERIAKLITDTFLERAHLYRF